MGGGVFCGHLHYQIEIPVQPKKTMNFRLLPVGLSLLLGLSFSLSTQRAYALQMFNVDFESPAHTIGALPASGASAGPTSVNFGSPIVVQDSILPTQSLEFQLPAAAPSQFPGNEQIEFGLGSGASSYQLSFDLSFDSLIPAEFAGEGFSVLFDTPTIQNLNFQRFNPNGPIEISVFQPTPSGPSFSQTIGTASDDELLQFAIDVDVASGRWTIEEGGVTLLDSDFFVFGTDLESIRFSLSDRDNNGDSRVLLDNVQISAVPEPTGLGMTLFAACLVACSRRRSVFG